MSFPKARVLALRGELSRQRVGATQNLALGDPGLLASKVMPRREQKKFTLGIVPHHLEKSNPVFGRLMRRLGHDVTLIDAQGKPQTVFASIDQCEHILSSSLHGLIVADSVANHWANWSHLRSRSLLTVFWRESRLFMGSGRPWGRTDKFWKRDAVCRSGFREHNKIKAGFFRRHSSL
jgi:pyruvyltransferase